MLYYFYCIMCSVLSIDSSLPKEKEVLPTKPASKFFHGAKLRRVVRSVFCSNPTTIAELRCKFK